MRTIGCVKLLPVRRAQHHPETAAQECGVAIVALIYWRGMCASFALSAHPARAVLRVGVGLWIIDRRAVGCGEIGVLIRCAHGAQARNLASVGANKRTVSLFDFNDDGMRGGIPVRKADAHLSGSYG